MNELLTAAWVLTPPVLVGLLFWFILHSITHVDRGERRALAKVEAAERAKRGLPRQS